MTGSVPDGRSSTRPASPSALTARSRERRTASLPCQSQPRLTGTLISCLREHRDRRGRLRERGATVDQRAQHGERRDDRIAGRVLVEADEMPRALAAERPPALDHRLEDVAVADLGARERHPRARERLLDAEVRHHRADDAAAERAAAHRVHRDDVQQLVAVVDAPVAIGHHEPVAVAVERDAEVGAMLDDLGREERGVRRAATGVDVEPIGGDADRHDRRAELAEHRRRDVVGRAVRAVDDQRHAAKIEGRRKRRFAELDVAPRGVGDAARLAELGRGHALERRVHRLLDRALGRVRELLAARGEELDAVVVVGIVRRADHDAGGQPQRARQVRDARRRQRAAQRDVDARGREARLERGLEQVARDARVLADEHRRTPGRPARIRGERAPGRPAELHHELGRDRRLADAAAHAVGAEVLALHSTLASRLTRRDYAPRVIAA
jgi:hypothetical protein